MAKGLTVGHEPVGVIEKLGSAVVGYTEGQRVIAGAICPNFNPTPRKTARLRKTAATSSPGHVRLPRLQGHRWMALWQPD